MNAMFSTKVPDQLFCGSTLPRLRSNRQLHVLCAEKDGKKKRPKKSQLPPPETPLAPQATTPPPPRVTQHSLIPVRRQIEFVNQIKTLKKPTFNTNTASYRKSTKTTEELKEERKQKDEEVKLLSKTESKNISLRSLYDSADSRHPPIVLVDGYNVMYKWEETKSLMTDEDEGLYRARDKLIEALGTYSKFRKMRVCVAFDAMKTGGIDNEHITKLGVTVRYCTTVEADTYIENQVTRFLTDGADRIVVITDDVAHKAVVDSRKTATRQFCFVIPCSGLIKDMASSQKESDEVFSNTVPNITPLGNVVKSKDKSSFDKMQQLRLKLN